MKKALFYKPYFIFSTLLSSLIAFVFIFLMVTAQVAPAPNPTLEASCGLDMVIAIDTSSSVSTSELNQMKTAANSFVNAFQGTPTEVALIQFDTTADLVSPFTDDLSSLTGSAGAIAGISGSGFTNWEDALFESRLLLPNRVENADLVVMLTDGNPTVDNGFGSPISRAINEANQVKGAGARIIAVGIGNNISTSNLEAISSPDAVYDASNFAALGQSLQDLATELCGGTVTINKVIDEDGNPQTTDDQTPGEGWSFDIENGQNGVLTDTSGQTQAISVDPGTDLSITENPQEGYTVTQASCTGATSNGSQNGNAIEGLNIAADDIVSCTFYNTPNQTDLEITKTDNLDEVAAGGSLTYTIVVTNNGPTAVTNATVNDIFPVELGSPVWTCMADIGSSCGSSSVGGPLVDNTLTLQPGHSATYTVEAIVDSGFTGELSNTATVSTPLGVLDTNSDNNTATDTTEVVHGSDISVEKIGPAQVVGGNSIFYTLSVTNNGDSDATNVVVTDTLPGDVTFVSATPTQGSCSNATGVVTCDLGDIEAGTTHNILINVTSPSSGSGFVITPGGASGATKMMGVRFRSFNNTGAGEIYLGRGDLGVGANRVEQQYNWVKPSTNAFTFSYDPGTDDITATLGSNSPLVFNDVSQGAACPIEDVNVLEIGVLNRNNGTTVNLNNLTLTDAAGSTNLGSFDGGVGGDGSDDVQFWTGRFFDFSQAFTFSGEVEVDGTFSNSQELSRVDIQVMCEDAQTGDLENNVTVTADQPDPDTDNNTDSTTTGVITSDNEVDLSVTKTDSPDPVGGGDEVTYTITVENAGPDTATGVTLFDLLPSNAIYVGATPAGDCNNATGVVTCDLGDIPSGGSAVVTVTLQAQTASDAMDDITITNIAAVTTAGALDTNPDNNVAVQETTVTPNADLSVTKTDLQDPVAAGNTIEWVIIVTNDGPNAAQGVTLNDLIPAGVSVTNVTTTQGSCTQGSTGVSCNLGDMNAGATANVTVTADVASSVAHQTVLENTVTVDSNTFDSNPNDNTTIEPTTVLSQFDLSIVKEDLVDPVIAGETETYEITVTNNGPSDAQNVLVTDLFPPQGVVTSMTPSQGSCTTPTGPSGGTGSCQLGTMAVGATATITVEMDVQSNANPFSTVDNVARVSSNDGVEIYPYDNADIATFLVLTETDISVEKVDTTDPVVAGGSLTYIVTVSNNGPSDAQNVVMTDTLPAGVTFVSATPDNASACDEVTGLVTCNLGNVAAGTSVNTMIIVDVPASTPAGCDQEGEELTNVASATTETEDSDMSNNDGSTSTEMTCVDAEADLSITKSDSADPIRAGDSLTYTLEVTNGGPSDAQDVTVTDLLPAFTDFVSATSTQGSCSYATGVATCDLGTVAAGASVTITITATPLTDGMTAGPVLIQNSASVNSSSTLDPNSQNNFDTENTVVLPKADFSITKTDNPDPVVAGDQLTYTLTVTNNGPSSVIGSSVLDTLPLGLAVDSVSSSQGIALNLGNTIVAFPGKLDSGSSMTITIVANVSGAFPDGTVIDNTALLFVPFGVLDPVLDNNVDTEDTTIVKNADLEMVKDGPLSVVAGEEFDYTLVMTNNGPANATGVIVTDTLPPEVTFVDADPDQGTYTGGTTGTITWDVGNVSSGDSVTMTITVAVAPDAQNGDVYTNTAVVEGNEIDPNPSNNTGESATVISEVIRQSDLSIEKTDDPDPVYAGQTLTYTLTAMNAGPSVADNVIVVDTLPSSVTLDSATPDQGTCGVNPAGKLRCELGTMNVGDTVNITVTVTPNEAGTIKNRVRIRTKKSEDTNKENNRDSEKTEVKATADLQIQKIDLQDPVNAGENIIYLVIVTNNGPTPSSGVVMTDNLPSGTTLVNYFESQGTCTPNATGTELVCDIGYLDVGASANVEIVVSTSPNDPNAVVRVNTATVTCEGDPEPMLADDDQVYIQEQGVCGPDTNQDNNTATEETTIVNSTPPPTSGGGVPDLPSGSGQLLEPEPEVVETAPVAEAIERSSCLTFDSSRQRTFTDLENVPSLWKRGIEGLKFTKVISSGDFVIDGSGLGPNDAGVETAEAKPFVPLNRLEMLKVIMLSHCLEIKDRSGETTRIDGTPMYNFNDAAQDEAFRAAFPGENFLPDHTGNEDLDYLRDVAYSALYYTVFDGTRERNAELFRPVTVSEFVKVMSRIRYLVEGKPPIQEDPGDQFWLPFYEVADEIGISGDFLADERTRDDAIRAETFYEIFNSSIKTGELYLEEVREEARRFLETGVL